MFDFRRSALCVTLICCGFLLSSQAQAFDLNGAWATSADQCDKIFVKKGNQITFTQYSEEFGNGFVATGKEVRGKTTRCTIQSQQQSGDTINYKGVCATDIMVSPMQFNLKILSDSSLTRVFPDPEMSGMQMTYYRCGAL